MKRTRHIVKPEDYTRFLQEFAKDIASATTLDERARKTLFARLNGTFYVQRRGQEGVKDFEAATLEEAIDIYNNLDDYKVPET